jgi:signal peptidase I
VSDGHAGHDHHDHGHDHGHGHGEAAAHDDHGHGAAAHHGDHGHGEAAHHDDHGHGDAHHDDHGHAAHAPAAAHGHDAHHGDHHAPVVETVAVAAAAAVAGAAHASDKKPVWSDHGDAPFEEAVAPVYDRKARKKGRSGGSGSETVEIIKTIFFALLIALILRIFLFQPFTIPSASMEPNLYEGDYIVVSKWSYGYSKHSIPLSPNLFQGRIMDRAPQRGDIVVFKLPRDNKTDYIKRLIGLPGDRIQMIANRLHINGQPVDDVVVSQSQIEDVFGPRPVTRLRETLPGGKSFSIQDFGPGGEVDDTGVYIVPAGHYFMMGDNRDNSVDSRYDQNSGVGLVPAENLIGKAEIILFSWSPGASLWNPVSWFANVRPSRFFTVLK